MYGISRKEYDHLEKSDQQYVRFLYYISLMNDGQLTHLLWRMRWEIFKDRALKIITAPARALEWALARLG